MRVAQSAERFCGKDLREAKGRGFLCEAFLFL
ncbi:hypothetical protein SAMN05892877_107166 [Rhizobium subbaraonis]|uniref:Uncharacterized protein n=1 Tax=Rhizobium subbaraonis TaxID=908946 RepID=A0A285UFA4_9HYPH|nr:hypothetical protein SAMN05892877_107166 [Rhizobium subbaraonis]